ncbi:polysaccharide lyase 6 family protein [Sphingorhabdus arenilitoris]|uniref:Polysaccharide lyase 6 family protein n=1 Tax=Sphingorhabdus arenilitoris TaxID=1490041 RepID=A0ABV8RIR9_9SPHN
MLRRAVFSFAVIASGSPLAAEDYLVSTQAEFFSAAEKLAPGDIITLTNGTWRDFEMVVSAKGTAKNPILIRPETPGKVIISGKSNLRIGGSNIIVTGLVFKDGYSPTGDVISFRSSKSDLAYDSRVTEVVIDHFSKPDRFDDDYWVSVYGKRNRLDHNHFTGKTNKGVTVAVRLDSEESRQNSHRIDHNYFGPRPVLGSNGGETLRIGTSTYSMFDSNTVVEDNYFDRCDGEVEIISVKSGRNIIRRNVFVESSGTLTLRHGDGNVVERNVFLGNGKDHSGGIRVINKDQVVRGNYLEGLRGSGFSSALTIMNGVPNSPVNRYVQVSGAVIEKNSIVNSSYVTLAGGADAERSAPPIDSIMADNLFTGGDAGPKFVVQDDISGIKIANNALIGSKQDSHPRGIIEAPVGLTRAENGLLYPDNPKYTGIGAPRDLKPVGRDEVGAAWYPKPMVGSRFGVGAMQNIAPDENALESAISSAPDGGIISLGDGSYMVSKTLTISKALTIKGTGNSVILFDRPALFEIAEGGSLRLESLSIDGTLAPDAVGNSVIRTSAFPMQSNFMIELENVKVSNLTVNKYFDVIKLGKSAFADRVLIRDSSFTDISGSVLMAAAETEDYGQYNAEYVDISRSYFRNIGGPVVQLYRGGRDESTFGPHFTLIKSQLENIGRDGNNLTKSALLLHGVQVTEISENDVSNSAPVRVVHTVGKPSTRIAKNRFTATPAIQVEELEDKSGEQRAILENNSFSDGGE